MTTEEINAFKELVQEVHDLKRELSIQERIVHNICWDEKLGGVSTEMYMGLIYPAIISVVMDEGFQKQELLSDEYKKARGVATEQIDKRNKFLQKLRAE